MIDVPVEVKDALRDGRLKKNYRVVVLDDEGTEDFTIDNNNLVSESVSIDERMCSGNKIKFGLCEGSSLEFQYFGFPSILGKRLQVFIDVDYEITSLVYETQQEVPRDDRMTITEDGNYRIYSDTPEAFLIITLIRDGEWQFITATSSEDGTEAILDNLLAGDLVSVGWIGSSYPSTYLQKQVLKKQIESYTIPMGFFDVQKCSRQASTGIIKATAYNKLMSDYLDAKANDLITTINPDNANGKTSLYTILKHTLNDYGIDEKPKTSLPLHFNQSSTGGIGRTYPNIPCKLVGNTNTFYPTIGSRWNCVVDSGTLTGANVITIEGLVSITSAFIELLTNVIDSMFESVLTRIQTPETIWQQIINEGFTQAGVELVWQSGGKKYFTLPDLCNHVNTMPIYGADTFRNVYSIRFWMPSYFDLYKDSGGTSERYTIWGGTHTLDPSMFEGNVFITDGNELSQAEKISVDTATLPDVTLRELQTATFETVCQFGQLDRVTDLFSGVELNNARLLPQETLYPDNDLYPDGAKISATRAMYSKLWADEGNVHKWKYLIITYKGLDEGGNEKDFTLQRTVNADGTDNYNCSDNWLFRNLTWTAVQIGVYADAMVEKMRNVTWFPFEMWCAGLPYLETGDEIEIPLGEESYTSYILQRQLKGIQNLQDTYINGTLDIF